MGEDYILRVGCYADGMFIFPYRVTYFAGNEKGNTSYIDEGFFYFGKKLFNIAENDSEGYSPIWELNLNRLVVEPDVIELLMNNLNKMEKDIRVYYGVVGDNNWYEWDMN